MGQAEECKGDQKFPWISQLLSMVCARFFEVSHVTYYPHKKREKFEWTDDCERSFQELKKGLTSAPKLTIPEGKNGFVIYSDA